MIKETIMTIDCTCGDYHYIMLEQWDEFVTFAVIDYPASFWQVIKNWWKHKRFYVCDVVLEEKTLEKLIAKLTLVQRKMYGKK